MERKIILRFTKETWNQPVIHGLSRHSNLVFNILEAKVLPRQEAYAIMSLEGTEEDYLKGVEYLRGCRVTVEEVHDKIKRDEDSCTHCGVCTAVCPSGALSVGGAEYSVVFDAEKCVACGCCVQACTVKCIQLFIF